MKGPRSVAAAAALGNMLNGWDSAALAGALLFLVPEFNLGSQPVLQGLIVAASLVGAAVSTTFAGSGADWLGRRTMLSISATIFCIGALFMLWSPNVYVLLLARIVDGVAVGLAVTVAPMYISEVSPSEIRGELNTFPQFAGTSGMFLVYCFSFAISLTPSPSWRLMLAIILLPSLLYLSLSLFFMPESPRWLVSKGRTKEARQVLQLLRNKNDVSGEMALLIEGLGVGQDVVLEEYVLQPAAADADDDDEEGSPWPAAAALAENEPHLTIFDTEDGAPWIARPLSSYKGSQGFLSRPPSLILQRLDSRRQSIPLMDTLVPLMGSIKDMAAAFEGTASNQKLESYAYDEESAYGYSEDDREAAGAMEESQLKTPMLSRQATEQWEGEEEEEEEEELARANSAMARSKGGGGGGGGVGVGVGGGWRLALQWTSTAEEGAASRSRGDDIISSSDEQQQQQGEYKRIYLFQAPESSSQMMPPSSAMSLPRYGTMSSLAPIQAAALVSRRPSNVVDSGVGTLLDQAGPALLHPSATVSRGPAWSDLIQGGVKQALMVGVSLQILEQFGGINAVLNFTPQILQESGAEVLLSSIGINSNSASVLTSAIINLLCLPCIFIAMRLMDSLGRRTILLRTIPVLIAALLLLVIVNLVPVNEAVFAVVSVLSVLVYVGLFVMGFGPIPNMLCAEIFPTRVRGLCIGICQAAMWITDILVTQLFPVLNDSIGIAGTFGVFAAFCFISWVFVFLKVPETKGMPLEVIVEFFAMSAAAAGKNRASGSR